MESLGTLVEKEAPLGSDPRWRLVELIIASQTFSKAARLSQFLVYVSERALTGRADEINEQHIGEQVFDRRPGYDPGQDNIVRVQASRLRQRLEAYFSEEGAGEELRIVIPKGGYVPQFEAAPARQLPANAERPILVEPLSHTVSIETESIPEPSATRPSVLALRQWWPYVLILCILFPALWEVAYLRYQGPGASISFLGLKLVAVPISHNPQLWREVFQKERTTLVVPGDSGLVLYEVQSGKPVNLAQYLSGEVQTVPVLSPIDRSENKAGYRYTSIVDLQIASQLMTLPEAMQGHTQIRYTRDLKLDDLKENSIVLIGTKEANPWVELFEQHMNFAFDDNTSIHDFVVTNKSPRSGEQQKYRMDPNDSTHRAYALVALLPNLSRTGNVLILEGTTMAGTEAASDFAFDGKSLMALLQPYINSSGSLPHFEILLQTMVVGGGAPESKVLAYRIHPD